MQKVNAPNVITDVEFTEKKRSERPADPVLLNQPAPEPAKLTIEPFDDGAVFKYVPHPKANGQFILVNRAGLPVGVISSAPIADLLCQAVQMLFAAAELARKESEQLKSAEAQLAQQAPPSPVMES